MSLQKTVRCTNNKTRVIPSKDINPFVASNGYLAVDLTAESGGKKKRAYIHRLIYNHFVSEIPKGMVINHKDMNKLNNSPDNLECVTQRDNVRHYFNHIRGCSGVTYDKHHRGKKWRATIWNEGRIYLGYHHTQDEAERSVRKYIQKNLNHLKYR